MTDFEFVQLVHTIDKPKEKIAILLIGANNQERVWPWIKARLAGITTFAENKE